MDLLDRDAALATAERIKGFPAATVAEIVSRIPPTHLENESKEVIIEALTERAKTVPDVIASSTKRG